MKVLANGSKSDVFFWLVALVSLGLSLAFLVDLTPWLRGAEGEFEWRWLYHPRGIIAARLLLVALVVAGLAAWYWLGRRSKQASAWWLALLIPLGLALQLSIQSSGPRGLEIVTRVLNPGYFGYYPPATQIENLPDFIDTYAENQHRFDHPRMQTHPPGNVVFHWVMVQLTRNPLAENLTRELAEPRLNTLPDWMADYSYSDIAGGMLASLVIPTLSVVAALPLYALARDAFGQETARRSAMLYVLAPVLTMFAPKIDIVYTLLSSAALWLLYRGVKDGGRWRLVMSGVLCSAGWFMSYSLIPLPLACGIFLLGTGFDAWRDDRRATLQRLAQRLALFGVGSISVQISMAIAFGFEPLSAFSAMLGQTAPYNEVRNYWYSLFYTPYDLLIFAGFPVAIYLLSYVWRMARSIARREALQAVDWILIGSLVAMGLMILSGVQKAENARVFAYFTPVTVLFGAAETKTSQQSWRRFGLLAGLTLAQLLVFHAVLETYR